MKIKNCRSCKSSNLKYAFSLGKQAMTGIFPSSKKTKISFGELSLVKCEKCNLLQLKDNFDHDEMYGSNYGYMSSLNKSMKFHLLVKAKNLIRKYNLKSGDRILDIGSNDGTFLSFFNKKYELYGCDPTINKFKNYYRKDIKIVPTFFNKENFTKKNFKLITSIAMFYDLIDPFEFASQIADILVKNGIWHIELSYMPSMIKNTSYDTICHEHLEYYSLSSLKNLLDRTNLKIINMSFNHINGGSIELDISKKKSKYKECKKLINWVLNREDIYNYNSLTQIKNFYQECLKHRKTLRKLLFNLKDEGKKVLGYGASTKGNVILQFCKINENSLKYIGEVNKFKYNKYTPGSKIKIVSESILKKHKPDYLLVLPWHFKDHIIKKEKKFLNNGGNLIFPLPEIEII